VRRDTRVVNVPLMEQLIVRSQNRSSRARTLPVGGNSEYYLREGQAVLRKKSSNIPTDKLPQIAAIRKCAAELKKKDTTGWTRQDVYNFMDECLEREGFKGK